MALFRRGKKFRIVPTEHIAVLYVKNDHMGVEVTLDLSDLDQDEMTSIFDYIEGLYDLRTVPTIEDEDYE